nr:hypothetical protein [Escherichia coli]
MWRWPLRRQTAKLSRKSARCWKRCAGGWGAGLRHYGIAVAGDKKKQPA